MLDSQLSTFFARVPRGLPSCDSVFLQTAQEVEMRHKMCPRFAYVVSFFLGGVEFEVVKKRGNAEPRSSSLISPSLSFCFANKK